MNALVIDSSSSRLNIAAKKGSVMAQATLDIGAKQSQSMLPLIDWLLKQIDLTPAELDYTALTKGPGTFTGLRISFAALKSIQLASADKVKVYAIPTLKAYAAPYDFFDGLVVSVIDAKKNQFFARISDGEKVIMEAKDTNVEEVLAEIKKSGESKKILTVGPDAASFAEILKKADASLDVKAAKVLPYTTDVLFDLAEKMIVENAAPLEDYEGPDYMRKSEAELALEGK